MMTQRESQVEELAKRAKVAHIGGFPQEAVRLGAEAIVLARQLAEENPDERNKRMLAALMHNQGAFLIDAGPAPEAIKTLDESEQAYSRLRGTNQSVDAWIADVYARRSRAHAEAGAGASAVIELQSAVSE